MHGGAWSPQVDNVLGKQHHLYAIGRPDNLFIFKDLPEIQKIYMYIKIRSYPTYRIYGQSTHYTNWYKIISINFRGV